MPMPALSALITYLVSTQRYAMVNLHFTHAHNAHAGTAPNQTSPTTDEPVEAPPTAEQALDPSTLPTDDNITEQDAVPEAQTDPPTDDPPPDPLPDDISLQDVPTQPAIPQDAPAVQFDVESSTSTTTDTPEASAAVVVDDAGERAALVQERARYKVLQTQHQALEQKLRQVRGVAGNQKEKKGHIVCISLEGLEQLWTVCRCFQRHSLGLEGSARHRHVYCSGVRHKEKAREVLAVLVLAACSD